MWPKRPSARNAFFRISHMPIRETRSARQTSTKESDQGVAELPSRVGRFRSGGVAPAAFDRPFQAGLLQSGLRVPILILGEADREESARRIAQRGAQERNIENQSYRFSVGGRCAR